MSTDGKGVQRRLCLHYYLSHIELELERGPG